MTPAERLNRRRLFAVGGAALGVPAAIAACGDDEGEPGSTSTTVATEPDLPPTPACDDGDEPTAEQTEGPFFTPDSPERSNLRDDGVEGDLIVITGTVLARNCKPLPGALLDFWQADGNGNYDNDGFRARGHQFADAKGRFELETVRPGAYPGRTAHIHVKVQPDGGSVLTTQLYFPGEPGNDSDPLYDQRLEIAFADGGESGVFHFVLDV